MSTTLNHKRDYSLTGPENDLAQQKGLVAAEWYTSQIPRSKLKELMKRKDGPAIRDTIIWFCALAAAGFLAYFHGEPGGLSPLSRFTACFTLHPLIRAGTNAVMAPHSRRHG